MKNRVKMGLILAVLCVSLLWITACSSSGGNGEGVGQQLVKVTRGDLTVSVAGSGKIETSREARLTFGSAGKVARILFEEGARVSKGEVLAKLDTSALELARAQAEAALTQAEVALNQGQLAQKTAEYNLENIRDTGDTLKLALFNAQISLELAQKNLDAGITAVDYEAAKAQLNRAQAWYEYVGKNPTAAGDWQWILEKAKEKLDAAQAEYDNVLAGYNTQDVAIKKKQVEAATMAVAQAQKNLDKLADDIAMKELQVDSAKQSVGQAQQSVELARLSLAEAQRQLNEATIAAPFDGVIAQVLVKEGDNIPSPSMAPTPVIYLIDPAQMELNIEVDEIDIPQVKLNQEATISIDALPGVEFKGTVAAVLPVPKEEGGVVIYNVKLTLNVPENSGIRIGMSASADIMLEKHSQVLLVPSRAVQKDSQGQTIVKVMSGKRVEARPVVVGLDDGLRTEIISGLNEEETVVVEVKVKSTSLSMFGQ